MNENFSNSLFAAEMAKGTIGTKNNSELLWVLSASILVIGTISIIYYVNVQKHKELNISLKAENEKLKRT